VGGPPSAVQERSSSALVRSSVRSQPSSFLGLRAIPLHGTAKAFFKIKRAAYSEAFGRARDIGERMLLHRLRGTGPYYDSAGVAGRLLSNWNVWLSVKPRSRSHVATFCPRPERPGRGTQEGWR